MYVVRTVNFLGGFFVVTAAVRSLKGLKIKASVLNMI